MLCDVIRDTLVAHRGLLTDGVLRAWVGLSATVEDFVFAGHKVVLAELASWS